MITISLVDEESKIMMTISLVDEESKKEDISTGELRHREDKQHFIE